MKTQVRFTEYPLSCCNYWFKGGSEVPSHCREVFNEETGETIVLDYTGHSLHRAFETEDRQYSFEYVCELIVRGFDNILGCKCGETVRITNIGNSFDIIGVLYCSDKADTYALCIKTVINKEFDKNKYSSNLTCTTVQTDVQDLCSF